MLEESYEEEDEDEDEYYRPRPKKTNSPLDKLTIPSLQTAYCIDEQNEKKHMKEVRFKTDENLDIQNVGNPPQEFDE